MFAIIVQPFEMARTFRHLHNPFGTGSRHDDTRYRTIVEYVLVQSGRHEPLSLVVLLPPPKMPIHFFLATIKSRINIAD